LVPARFFALAMRSRYNSIHDFGVGLLENGAWYFGVLDLPGRVD
jgi:hypothetical protein